MNNIQDEILAAIQAIEKDEALYERQHFSQRAQALDHIDFHIIDRIEAMNDAAMNALKQHAEQLKQTLEDIDKQMFQALRAKIKDGSCRAKVLMNLISEYVSYDVDHDTGYDDLDVFINGLLSNDQLPTETKDREPGMVFYQKTPARIILALVEKASFKPEDVFVDIGCGLGQVNILVHLLTGVRSIGIEYEPAFCSYAIASATGLSLTDVRFINADARTADYSTGTVFFMYTPFTGKMLHDVLQHLKTETANRKIKLYTYGPCTTEVAQQDWLMCKNEINDPLVELAEFTRLDPGQVL